MSEIEHFSLWLSTICMSFGKYLFESFAHVLFGLVCFMLLSCRSSLFIVDINPLSNIRFATIFSHLLGCLLTLLTVSFDAQKFYLEVVQLIYFFFCHLSFWCLACEIIAKSNITKLFSYVLLQKVYRFSSYI